MSTTAEEITREETAECGVGPIPTDVRRILEKTWDMMITQAPESLWPREDWIEYAWKRAGFTTGRAGMKRRRWTKAEKIAIVQETNNSTVSAVSRKYGISLRLLFNWRTHIS